MPVFIADTLSGKLRNSDDWQFADTIIELRKNKDPWTVIERLVEMWIERENEEYMGYKVHVQDMRENLRDKKFGTTLDKTMNRRILVSMPVTLHRMIRAIYPVTELPFDRKFFMTFAEKFPFFKVPEKI